MAILRHSTLEMKRRYMSPMTDDLNTVHEANFAVTKA